MAFFAVFDEWPTHEKTVAAGRDGRGLWIVTGPMCSKVRTDGHVSELTIRMALAIAEVPRKRALDGVVGSGLWHDHKTIVGCDRCYHGEAGAKPWVGAGDLRPGAMFFHDWWHYQQGSAGKTDSIEQMREQRRKRLSRNRQLCAAIRQRDRDICRYCAVATVWATGPGGDRKTDVSGTYDHLDPFDFGDGSPRSDGGNAVHKVVVACRLCNSLKRDRDPAAWLADGGRPLLDAPPKLRLR